MLTPNNIEQSIFEWAPRELAMKGDYNGLIAGRRDKPIRRTLVALDISRDTIREAAKFGADVIVAHHPIVWGESPPWPTTDTDAGNILLALCEAGIAGITMHTNIDAAAGGISDILAETLGLIDVEILGETDPIARIGKFPKLINTPDFALLCKTLLKTSAVRYFDNGKPNNTLALCPGGGAFMFEEAIRAGCDVFLTGEAKHSTYMVAQNQGISLLECGHFATEHIIVPKIASYLSAQFPDLEVLQSQTTTEPYEITCL